jgi:2-oxoglutarate dehydrogenase E2 component (dihydrolipoamide succinyltransferase)
MSDKLEIVVPAAGESVTEADVGVILTPTGSQVAEDEAILELETEKSEYATQCTCRRCG